MTLTLHGIPNCDTMKKARDWLDHAGIAYAFHDYKKVGVTAAMLEAWCREVGWEVLLNRAGTTFRKLPEADKQGLNEARAIALMVAQPGMIKRPVLTGSLPGTAKLLVGFKPESYAAVLAK